MIVGGQRPGILFGPCHNHCPFLCAAVPVYNPSSGCSHSRSQPLWRWTPCTSATWPSCSGCSATASRCATCATGGRSAGLWLRCLHSSDLAVDTSVPSPHSQPTSPSLFPPSAGYLCGCPSSTLPSSAPRWCTRRRSSCCCRGSSPARCGPALGLAVEPSRRGSVSSPLPRCDTWT